VEERKSGEVWLSDVKQISTQQFKPLENERRTLIDVLAYG
jgi:hypothetical protein